MMNQKKNIFITGGSGFIGKHLIDEMLSESNFNLYILTRNPDKIPTALHNKVNIVKGDLFQLNELDDILKKIDYFVNIAGEKKSDDLMQKVNVEGTHAFLEVLSKYPNVKLIHISTSGIYGIENHPESIITETSKVYPNNFYETTKYESEKAILNFGLNHPLRYIILRPSNVFGEFEPQRKLLNLFQSLRSGKFFYLDRKARVNYVYVKYLTAVIIQCVNNDLVTNQAYNVNAPCTLFEFIENSKKAIGIRKRTLILPSIFKVGIMLMSRLFDLLPKKYQVVNSLKYRELTNKRIYAIDNVRHLTGLDEMAFLNTGIKNLVKYYQKEGLL